MIKRRIECPSCGCVELVSGGDWTQDSQMEYPIRVGVDSRCMDCGKEFKTLFEMMPAGIITETEKKEVAINLLDRRQLEEFEQKVNQLERKV